MVPSAKRPTMIGWSPPATRLPPMLKAKRKAREEYIDRCIMPIGDRLKEEGFKFEINGRAKHLYSIYNKLDVTSRTAAARFAVEPGLV